MKSQWEDRFRQNDYIYGTAPNSFFKHQLFHLPAGRLLLPAEGEGRNAVYAAKQGWQVQALDFSTQGRKKALQLARQNKVKIDYIVSAAELFNYPANYYDAAALIYAHFPASLRADIHRLISRSIRHGGTLILEAFGPDQLQYQSGGPKDPSMLYTVEMMKADFPLFEMDHIQYAHIHLSEGPIHQGTANVLRMVARKTKP